MAFSLDAFDYTLPERLIAQSPAEIRDASRLMVISRAAGQWRHGMFRDLPDLLRKDDLLVMNNTKVIPAKFACYRSSGGRLEGLFLHTQSDGSWEVLLRNAGRCQPGEILYFDTGKTQGLELLENQGEGQWRVVPNPPGPAEGILETVGVTPLPTYIKRPDAKNDPADRQRYQTVYAAHPGAVAAPTAGLHFTPDILNSLETRGIETVYVTLHVGLGTFAPVKSDDLTRHEMHSEYYVLNEQAAVKVAAAKSAGRRVVAVGTTSVRVLETVAAAHDGQVVARSGWTNLFLYPPAKFHVTDALLTNFHLPKSTLLMLVAAFCRPGRTEGLELLKTAYAEAIREEYRFFSYGDAMLIE
ncbi:MAG: tRNA preQ1(34) S-adenosylmethionine ribosyltransferase-isomerase QueA [Phycisphaerae bacterium]|nr:tRNA preQ1(34) S-adenosylmethionine ribosyltransferase-isomerase QueA [Phycisphaerae bacterium]